MAAYLRHSARGGMLSPKDAAIPEKIAQEEERILQLSNEKVACADRIVHLLTKAMGRLDVDLARAMDRTGEGLSQDAILGSTGPSRTPLEKLPDTLRGALQSEGNGSIVLSSATGATAPTPHPPTKRPSICLSVVRFILLFPYRAPHE
jgi:chromatin modification-related protein YNG2